MGAGPAALEGLGAVGAGLHIAGSVLIVVGQLLVRISHCIKDSGAADTWGLPKSAALTPRWRRPDGKWRRQLAGSKTYAAVGWSLFAVGNVARFVSMRFAAQTVLSGLGSLQFVVIPIASRHLLGIKPTGATILGLVVVLLGNVLILAYGPAEAALTLHQLRYQWTTSAMQTFLLVLGSLLAGLQFLWRHLRHSLAEHHLVLSPPPAASARSGQDGGSSGSKEPATPQPPPLVVVVGGKAGSGGGSGSEGRGGLELLLGGETFRVYAGALLFSAVASFIGAWSVLFSKSLTYVVSGLPDSLSDWYSWVVLAAFLGTAAFWVRQSDRGLKLYPATLIMPLMQAFWMCMSVLQGGVYFGEFSSLPPHDLAWLLAGVVLSLAGAIGMGVSGYAYEQPQNTLAYALSPKASGSMADLEAQELTLAGQGRAGGGTSHAVQADLLSHKLAMADGYASPLGAGNAFSSSMERLKLDDDELSSAEAAALLPASDRLLSMQGSEGGSSRAGPVDMVIIDQSSDKSGGLIQRKT